LNDLASHGKSRTRTAKNDNALNNNTWYHQLLHGETFLLPKRLFLHFYVTGIISTVVLYLYVTSISDDASNQNHVALTLLLIHLARRIWECVYVHAWRSSSRMHLAGYALGMGHYVILPLVFVDVSSVCTDAPLEEHFLDWRIAVIGVSTCLWAQYQQYRHHCILAELRDTAKDAATTDTQCYSIPSRGWFVYVSCPHYLAEILIYTSFALVLYSSKNKYKTIALLLWVATNLVVSAIKSHDWYLLQYPEYASFQRRAVIPFLL
jgi:3-oxo-5-alpha-steroid 4-dehydrogenase 3